VDGGGNVFVADRFNNRIRKITATGVVTTLAGSGVGIFADGQGTSATFYNPFGVSVDGSGNVYVADFLNHRIRKITATGVVTTLAGSGYSAFADGNSTSASFNQPTRAVVDGSGNVYVADQHNHRIRKITATGVVTTLAGSGNSTFADGNGTSASFRYPTDVAVDGNGVLYVADTGNHRIRKITPSGVVTTLAGSGIAGYADGQEKEAIFNLPTSVALDSDGNLYVSDRGNNRIRKITISN
jgi:sugar lactone lactonase YvrE